jgi:hypothetical protein
VSCRLTSGGECLGVFYERNSASHPKTPRTAMGVTFHSTYRVEGRRDETPTIKTDWSPRSAAEAKEKPASMNRRARRHAYLRWTPWAIAIVAGSGAVVCETSALVNEASE